MPKQRGDSLVDSAVQPGTSTRHGSRVDSTARDLGLMPRPRVVELWPRHCRGAHLPVPAQSARTTGSPYAYDRRDVDDLAVATGFAVGLSRLNPCANLPSLPTTALVAFA